MSDELKPGPCWLKVQLKNFSEDKLAVILMDNVVCFTFLEGSVPQIEVRSKYLRQNPIPSNTADGEPTLGELRARLEERKMCIFHEPTERCSCFHCRRYKDLEKLIREKEESME